MRRDLWIGILLAALTLGVFWPLRNHDFISYDDPEFITENLQIRSGINWITVVYAFTHPVVGNWHPVTTLSHALDCELWGTNAGAHHLVNALLHAANAMLLYLLLRYWLRSNLALGPGSVKDPESPVRWSTSEWCSLVVAVVFALHPLRVESVAWVSERKDLLSGLFFILTLWMYTLFARWKTSALSKRRTRVFYAAALASYAFGLMSKPMLVTLPFLLLLIDYWPLGRFLTPNLRFAISNFRNLIVEKVPFFVLAALDCWITLAVQKSAGALQVIAGVSWSERFANAITSYTRYLGKLFWPTDLAVVYPHPAKHYYLSDQSPGWEIVAALLLLVMVSTLCVFQLRSRPYLMVGWFWYLGMLVPVIGLIQVGEQSMADRYTYLPLIGPVLALACWLDALLRRTGRNGGPHPVSHEDHTGKGAPVTVVAGGVRSGLALPRPRTRRICSMTTVGIVGVVLGLLTRHQLGYWQDSVTLFDHAIAVTPDNPSAQFAMGVGLENQGDLRRAMVRYRVAVAIDTNYGKAYYNMGQILRKQQMWEVAADAYSCALRVNPNDAATELNLASTLPHLERASEAAIHFERALLLDPNSIEGLNNLAWLRATNPDSKVRDGVQAVQLAERACALTGFKVPVLLGTLGAAYAEAGRFAEAVSTAQNACALATQTGDSTTVSKNQQLMALYQQNKAYRESQ